EQAEGHGVEHRRTAARLHLRGDQQDVSKTEGEQQIGGLALHPYQSSEIFLRSSKFDSILPAPSTTVDSGSSAIATGRPVSSRRRLSRFFSSDPPPVSTMPRSTMSADSSGGVRSSATRTASTITLTVSASAVRISSSVMVMVLGTPSIRWRPLISIVILSSSGKAEPISILM